MAVGDIIEREFYDVEEINPRRKGITDVVAGSILFELHGETVEKWGLRVGQRLTPSQLESLVRQSNIDRPKSRALWLLSRQDYTRKKLGETLRRGGFKKQWIELALDRLEELGLIDDERFARNYAQIHSAQNMSNREILEKLVNKGVHRSLAKEIVEELTADPIEQILVLLEGKYNRRLNSEDGLHKVFATLERKGFYVSDIRQALNIYYDRHEFGEDNDEEF